MCFYQFFEKTCPELKKQSKSYIILLTRSPYSIAMPYSRGGRSEAQQNNKKNTNNWVRGAAQG